MVGGRWARIGAWLLAVALACASAGATAASTYFVTVAGTPASIACTNTGFTFGSTVTLQWQLKSTTSAIDINVFINGGLVGTTTVTPGSTSGSAPIGANPSDQYPSTPFPYTLRIEALPQDSYTDGVQASFDCPSAVGTNWSHVTLPPKVPKFLASPQPVNFPATAVGDTAAAQVVTVTNGGTADATSVALNNSNPTEFPITMNTCSGALAMGATCTYSAAFRPSTGGSRTATVQVADEGGAAGAAFLRGTGTGGPQLSLTSSVAFGSQAVGSTSAPNNVTVTNIGSTTATVASVTSSNAAEFPVTTTCASVPAAGTCTIAISFKPTAAGARSGTVTVASDGVGSPQTISVTGTGTSGGGGGTGQLSLPGPVTFAAQAVGTTSAPQGATITNVGTAPVTVTSVTSSNPEFPVTSTCTTVAAGATCALSLTFAPTAVGARSATVTVTSNGTGSPQTLAVSGTGTAAPTPGQLVFASEVNFGSVEIGKTTAPAPVAVTNVGGTPVAVASVGSSNPSEFAVTSSNCGTLATDASCAFELAFTPGAQGARSATITVVSNGAGSPQTMVARGTGVAGPPPPPPTADVIEYYHAEWDHYFMTSIADEIAKLDAGVFAGWARTGYKFKSHALNTAGDVNVCRFFSTSFGLRSSHFYTPFASECAIVKGNPDWQFEGEVFGIPIPDTGGVCPAGTIPVYRLYNNGQGNAPNHRYTTDLNVRAQMIARGWIPEGYGPLGVIMCAPV